MEGITTAPAPSLADSAQSGTHRIRSFAISGGFLDGIQLDLAEGLNCLIGARGTGKTTVLELVRYALDALPAGNSAERHRIENLVKANLGNGTIEVGIETRDGLAYRVIRSWQDDPVVVTADGAATDISLRPNAAGNGVFRAHIYSQNEIERIAEQSQSQLSLIDTFAGAEIAAINAELRTLTSKLATNATAIAPLQEDIETKNTELASKGGIDEKLKGLGPITGQNAEEVTKGQQAKTMRQRESDAMDGLWQFLQDYDEKVEALQGQVESQARQLIPDDLTNGANGEAIKVVRQKLLDGGVEIDDLMRQSRNVITRLQDALGDAGTALTTTHAEQEAAYQRLLQADSAIRGQASERTRLEKLLNGLRTKERDRDALIDKQAKLQDERTDLLRKLSELRDQRYAIRRGIAERINNALHGAIRVTVEQSGHLGEYRNLVESLLDGVRVKRGMVAQQIVERVTPMELVALIRSEDVEGLQAATSLNADQARKVVDGLRTADALYSIESVELADRPCIELKDCDSYKESSALSTGQKCTTILPILLLDSDTPLLVDQPEDNLDNRFICESVVESIRTAKAARQLVFVTHNPNIPVLADAERVFVLESDGGRARTSVCGDVDACRESIVNLLEGGEQAFKRRQERYAY
jgi:ABC-type lipoprotein export system ATPase subunit